MPGFRLYFDEPFYVGFDVGGFELGLQPSEPEGAPGDNGVVAYWGLENADEVLGRLLEMGPARHGSVQNIGGGLRVAAVLDPEGNAFGTVENACFSTGMP